ncbi:uracil-DNA glycosylase [Candidatus Woesearchaeota archaeon]|nr:uracil-DNA glycosylase [Candidatus Woesearchaeota archaeon]
MACKWNNVCPLRRLEQQSKISADYKKEYCESEENWKNCVRFKLEEQGISHKDSLMPDGRYMK